MIFMKKLLGIVLIAGMLHSCKEVLPVRTTQSVILDTTYVNASVSAPQTKKVLFEEFTGAHCVNCPDGKAKLDEIIALYPNNIAVIGLHTGNLSLPVKPTDPNFITTFADEISAAFGMTSMPSAMIDRKVFGAGIIQGRFDWKTHFETAKASPVKVNINATTAVDPQTDSNVLDLTMELLEEYTGDLNYTIALTESKIIATQLNGSVEIEDYEHEFVLRKMYTNSLGNSLKKLTGKTTYSAGQVFKKKLVVQGLEPSWKKENMKLVIFVSDVSKKEVLQAFELKY